MFVIVSIFRHRWPKFKLTKCGIIKFGSLSSNQSKRFRNHHPFEKSTLNYGGKFRLDRTRLSDASTRRIGPKSPQTRSEPHFARFLGSLRANCQIMHVGFKGRVLLFRVLAFIWCRSVYLPSAQEMGGSMLCTSYPRQARVGCAPQYP